MLRTAPVRRISAGVLFLATTLGALQVAVAGAPASAATPGYSAVTVPLRAVAVNDDGLVAGTVLKNGSPRAATWSKGRLVVLPLPKGATAAQVTDVSSSGVVSGSVSGTRGISHAVLWVSGRPRLLPNPPQQGDDGGPVQSYASAVNDRGDAAGAANYGFGYSAVAWRDAARQGAASQLSYVSGGGAEDINENGVTVTDRPGDVGDAPLLACAFSSCATRLRPLGDDPSVTLASSSLNDLDRAVGYQYPTTQGDDLSTYHSLWWNSSGAPSELLQPAGDGAALARTINDHGVIVGDYESASGALDLVVWSGGTVRRIGVAGRSLDLNDKGQILTRNGATWRLLTPTSTTPTS